MRGEDGTGLAEGQALMVVLKVWFDELSVSLTLCGREQTHDSEGAMPHKKHSQTLLRGEKGTSAMESISSLTKGTNEDILLPAQAGHWFTAPT